MKIARGSQLEGTEHTAAEYLVVFWDRTRANAIPYRLTDVQSVWEVATWVESQVADGPLAGHFPEMCAVVRQPAGREPRLVRLTADYWGDVSDGRRQHPEPSPVQVERGRLGID